MTINPPTDPIDPISDPFWNSITRIDPIFIEIETRKDRS
jgi:hypothetical protein